MFVQTIPILKKIYSGDYDVTKLQTNVEEVLNAIKNTPFIYGNFIDDVTIYTTDTYIIHGLGRPWDGFVITDIDNGGVVYRSSTVNNEPDRVIILKATVQSMVTIYFF